MIRRISSSDREAFLALSREFYASEAVMAPIPERCHERTWDELLRAGTYLSAYIFEYEGKIAGYALLNRTFQHEAGGTVVWIEELFVRPEFRSKGLGQSFFDYLKETRIADYSWLRLEVEPENDRAISLYRRTGFESLPYAQMMLPFDDLPKV